MKTLSQIAFDFSTDSAVQQEPVSIVTDQRPVNVGLRIKALKHAAPEPVFELEVEPEQEQEPKGEELPKAVKKIKSSRGRKSIRQVEAEADLINIPDDESLFSKQYYSMGEVAEMFRVNQSLLRYWEAEFSILQPKKNKKGDRFFRPVDIKNLHLIYNLLRQRKYTIDGAKDFLKKNKRIDEKFEAVKNLEQIKSFLLELKAHL